MFYGWRVVAGTFLCMLCVVGFYTYAVSLLVSPVRAEFGVGTEQVMYAFTFATVLGLVLMPVGGVLADRYSGRTLVCLGLVLMGVFLWLQSLSTSIYMYILFFGLGMSVATSLGGNVVNSVMVARWFSASRGKALGVATIGTSIGGMLVPMLFSGWVESEGWRQALQNMALLTWIVFLPLVFALVRSQPADVGLEQEPEAGRDEGSAVEREADPALSVRDIIARRNFWAMGFALGLLFSAYNALMTNLAPFVESIGFERSAASQMIMLLSLCGLIGKLAFGALADRMPPKVGLWIAQGLVACSFIILSTQPGYPGLVAAMVIAGLATGGMLPIWGALVAHIFGLLSYGRAMGMMGPIITLCVMPSFPIVGRLYDMSGSYVLPMQGAAVLAIFSASLVLLMNDKKAFKT